MYRYLHSFSLSNQNYFLNVCQEFIHFHIINTPQTFNKARKYNPARKSLYGDAPAYQLSSQGRAEGGLAQLGGTQLCTGHTSFTIFKKLFCQAGSTRSK